MMTSLPGPQTTAAISPFGRLVRIVQENDRLAAALGAVQVQVREARLYLDEPGSHRALALAQLARLRARHSSVLAQLRANRIEARQILADAEAGRLAPSIESGRGDHPCLVSEIVRTSALCPLRFPVGQADARGEGEGSRPRMRAGA